VWRKSPFSQKSRQRAKNPAIGNIIGSDELQFRAGQQPAGGHYPFQWPRRAVTHFGLAIGQRTITQRARCLSPFSIAQPCPDLLTTDPSSLSKDRSRRETAL
jgi:hypothetical protein